MTVLKFPARMRPAVGVTELAMEAQVSIERLRSDSHALWEAAVATGDWNVMAETKALAATLKAARTQARRISGMGEAISTGDPDELHKPGHGRAA